MSHATLLDAAYDQHDTIQAVLLDGTNALQRLRKSAPVIDAATALELAITFRGLGMQMQRVVNSLEKSPKQR